MSSEETPPFHINSTYRGAIVSEASHHFTTNSTDRTDATSPPFVSDGKGLAFAKEILEFKLLVYTHAVLRRWLFN